MLVLFGSAKRTQKADRHFKNIMVARSNLTRRKDSLWSVFAILLRRLRLSCGLTRYVVHSLPQFSLVELNTFRTSVKTEARGGLRVE